MRSLANKEALINRPDVFKYEDIGTFLKEWFEYLKNSSSKFSLRVLNRQANISVGYLSMVLSNQRRLTENALHKILPHLKLTQNEIKFLKLLYIVGESEIPERRLEAFAEITKLAQYKLSHSKEYSTFQYLTKWHHVAIREMTRLQDFSLDPKWIQERLRSRLGLKEIEETLTFLEKNNFIIKNDKGRIEPKEIELKCMDGIYKISLGEFHHQILDLAYKSIEEVPRAKRYLLGRTTTLNESNFEKAKQILDEALEKIEKLEKLPDQADQEEKQEVFHFEFAAFPMTLKKEVAK